MNLVTKIIQSIAFAAGVVAWFFSTRFRLQAEIDRLQSEIAKEHDRRKLLMAEWKTQIDPRVLIAKDTFGFSRGGRSRPDTGSVTSDELFAELAEYAAGFHAGQADETGETLGSMIVWGRLFTAGRCIEVKTTMLFTGCDLDGKVFVIHPAAERYRWQHLDRAMKCFLN